MNMHFIFMRKIKENVEGKIFYASRITASLLRGASAQLCPI